MKKINIDYKTLNEKRHPTFLNAVPASIESIEQVGKCLNNTESFLLFILSGSKQLGKSSSQA